MTAMVIGGDHLGGITENLKDKGYDQVKHLSGRKVGHVKREITEDVDVILVLTDYVGTDLSRVVKTKAKECGLRVLFARRSWACISKEIDRVCSGPCKGSGCGQGNCKGADNRPCKGCCCKTNRPCKNK